MLIAIIAFSLIPVLTVARFLFLRSAIRRLGELRTALPREGVLRYAIALFSSCLLIALTTIRSIGLIGTAAVCGVGVLGFVMSFQELYSSRKNGIYRQGFVYGSMQVFFPELDHLIRENPTTITVQLKDLSRKQLVIEDTRVLDLLCESAGN